MKHILAFGLLLGMTASTSADVSVDVRQLAGGSVTVTLSPGTWVLKLGGGAAPTCSLVVPPAGSLAIANSNAVNTGCQALFAARPDTLSVSTFTKGGTTEKVVVPKDPLSLSRDRTTSEWKDAKTDLAGVTKVVYYSDKKWYSDTLDAFPSAPDVKNAELEVWAELGGAFKYVKIVKDTKPPEPVVASYDETKVEGDKQCRETRTAHPDQNVLCFIYAGGWTRLPDQPGAGTLMRPNTRVHVIAIVPPNFDVKFELSGDFGFADPKFRDETKGQTQAGGLVTFHAFGREWGPPKPGVHTLTVTLKDRERNATKVKPDDDTKVDITVDEPYAGAIRIGVAAVFGSARDRAFSSQALPGSGQMEITTTDGGVLDSELVIGAAAFLEEGGRTYYSGERRHWAPYFGIGILNQTTTGFEVLKSLHLGVEYEISKQFSISFTVVGRRVTRLVDGLEVGDPITATTVPTRTGYELGVGLIVNLTPEFLKLGKSPGSGFFK